MLRILNTSEQCTISILHLHFSYFVCLFICCLFGRSGCAVLLCCMHTLFSLSSLAACFAFILRFVAWILRLAVIVTFHAKYMPSSSNFYSHRAICVLCVLNTRSFFFLLLLRSDLVFIVAHSLHVWNPMRKPNQMGAREKERTTKKKGKKEQAPTTILLTRSKRCHFFPSFSLPLARNRK